MKDKTKGHSRLLGKRAELITTVRLRELDNFVFIYLLLVQHKLIEEITLLSFFVSDSSSQYIESEVRPAPRRSLMTGPGCPEDGLSVGNL